MRFRILNIRSLSRSGSLKVVTRKLTKHKLYSVGVQEVRQIKKGTEPLDDYTLCYENRNANHHLGTCCFVQNGTISAAKRLEFMTNVKSFLLLTLCGAKMTEKLLTCPHVRLD